jgi:hypothetical protein
MFRLGEGLEKGKGLEKETLKRNNLEVFGAAKGH